MKPSQYKFKNVSNSKCYSAVQYNGNNGSFLYKWSDKSIVESPICEPTDINPTGAYVQIFHNGACIETAIVGDWIVYDGEIFTRCSNDYFKKNFERISETVSFSTKFGASAYFNNVLFVKDRKEYAKAVNLYAQYCGLMAGHTDYIYRLIYEDFCRRVNISKWKNKDTETHLLKILHAIY